MRCIAAIRDSRGAVEGDAIEVPIEHDAKAVRLKGWLVKPKARTHFGAVVIMHGWEGLNIPGWTQAQRWSRWFNEQGFAAFILDSFTGRGLIDVCGNNNTKLPVERMQDLSAAAARLSGIPGVEAGADRRLRYFLWWMECG